MTGLIQISSDRATGFHSGWAFAGKAFVAGHKMTDQEQELKQASEHSNQHRQKQGGQSETVMSRESSNDNA